MNILSICTYNLMLTVPKPIRFNGQIKRSKRIAKSLDRFCNKHFSVDVVVFTELIDPICRKILLRKMKSYGWIFSSDVLYDKMFPNFKLINGGVVIVSKYKIIKKHNYIYKGDCQGYDCFAAKGIVYCRINKNGNLFNIFGTHLQAWDTPVAKVIRKSQANQCLEFINSFCIPHDEAVIVVGDLNIDFYTRNKEIQDLSKLLHVDILKHNKNSYKFSSDPKTNKLVGNDDANMYKTTMFPTGCYNEYMKHMYCICCPQELLDYICISKNHIRPLRTNVFSYQLKAEKKFVMNFNITTERVVDELSDHYPIIAQLAFVPTKHKKRHIRTPIGEHHTDKEKRFVYFLQSICLIFLVSQFYPLKK